MPFEGVRARLRPSDKIPCNHGDDVIGAVHAYCDKERVPRAYASRIAQQLFRDGWAVSGEWPGPSPEDVAAAWLYVSKVVAREALAR